MSDYVRLVDLAPKQVDEEYVMTEPISWEVSFPPQLDADRFVMNLDRVRKFNRIVGLGFAHVIEYQGDISTFTPGINSLNEDGSATASRYGEAKEVSLVGEATSSYTGNFRHFAKPEVAYPINKAELASQIVDEIRDNGVSREEAWAKLLNRAFKGALKNVAQQQLLTHSNAIDDDISGKAADMWWSSVLGLNTFVDTVVQTSPIVESFMAATSGAAYAMAIVLDARAKQITEGIVDMKERRWSVYPIGQYQPDRYLAAAGFLKSRNFVKLK